MPREPNWQHTENDRRGGMLPKWHFQSPLGIVKFSQSSIRLYAKELYENRNIETSAGMRFAK